MRVSTEVSVSLDGDISLAQKYVSRARTILGMMKASNNKDLKVQIWRRTLPDGTLIEVSSIHGRDYIRIYALVEEDPPVEEYLYVKHYDPTSGFKIWRYDRNGNEPVLIQNLHNDARTHFGMLAPKAGETPISYTIDGYDASATIKKDLDVLITPPLANGRSVGEIATNSSQLVVLDDIENYLFYNIDGTFDRVIPTINVAQGEQHLTVNDKILLVPNDAFTFSFLDYDGVILNSTIGTDRQSCNRDVTLVDTTLIVGPGGGGGGLPSIRLAVFNNLGGKIAEYFTGVVEDSTYSAIGITTDRVYLIFLGNTQADNRVDIYEHTLTFDTDGIADSAVFGPLLYSVPAPTVNGMFFETWQRAVVDSSLFKASVIYK